MRRIAEREKFKSGEEEIAERARSIAENLARTLGGTAGLYAELAPDGRPLAPSEAKAAREQLEATSLCLRSIDGDRDIIEFLAAEGRRAGQDSDLSPTISVLRMMQRSLALALSDDPARRAAAATIEELRPFVVPVHRFWRDK